MANKTKDATLQSTKQMLDELDALMEKMLSLPVNETDDGSASAPEVKSPSLPPTLSATLTLLEPPAKAPVRDLPLPEPEHPAVNPPHLEMPVAPPPPLPPPVREPAPLPEPMTNDVTPPSVMPKLEPLLEEIPEPDVPLTTEWGYLPLLWMNQAFDGLTIALGAGEWLRSQAGRMLLGVSGVALLAFAVAWLVRDWLGWN